MAERGGGRVIRASPIARGIGGLVGGAEGCVKHSFLVAEYFGLRHVCARGQRWRKPQTTLVVLAVDILVSPWFADQTHGGDVAVCFVAAGFLAFESISSGQQLPFGGQSTRGSKTDGPVDSGEDSILCFNGNFLLHDVV